MFKDAGFKEIKDEYHIRYTFNPKGRFEEFISKDRLQMSDENGSLSKDNEIELKKHRVANWRKQVEKQTLLSSNFTRETYYSLSHFHDPNLDAVKENINGVCKFLE